MMAATISQRSGWWMILIAGYLAAAAFVPCFFDSQAVFLALYIIYIKHLRMEQQAEDLLAVVKDDTVLPEVKIKQITELKAHIKHRHVPDAAISPSFEVIRVGIMAPPLQDATYSTLKHLAKRLNLQEQQHIVAAQGAKTYPLLVENLSDPKDRIRIRASQALTDLWLVASSDVEGVIRDVVLSGKHPRAKEAGLQWISKMNQEQGLQFRSFVPKIVDCLEDADEIVREAAKVTAIELFRNAPDRAKSDLKKTLQQCNVRKTIATHVLSQVGLASSQEVDLKASTQSHGGGRLTPRKDEPLASSIKASTQSHGGDRPRKDEPLVSIFKASTQSHSGDQPKKVESITSNIKVCTRSHGGDRPRKDEPLVSIFKASPHSHSGDRAKKVESLTSNIKVCTRSHGGDEPRKDEPIVSNFKASTQSLGADRPKKDEPLASSIKASTQSHGGDRSGQDEPLISNTKASTQSHSGNRAKKDKPLASSVHLERSAAPSTFSAAEDAEKIEPIYLNSYREVEDVFREMTPFFEDKETEQNWTHREKSVMKLRKITKGNAPNDFTTTYLVCVKGLLDGILKTVNSLRTTVSTNGCHLVQDIAKAAGPGLDPMVEILMQSLIKLCGGTKKISAQNGNATVNTILACVTYNVRLMQHIWNACQDKNVQPRSFATEWLKTIITKHSHHKNVLEHAGGLELIEKCIKKGLTDANPGVRTSMRPTYWAFWRVWPDRSDIIMSALEAKQQEQLLKDTANPNPSNEQTSTTATAGKVAPLPRSTGSRPSLKETIAAQKRAKMAANDLPEDPVSALESFSPIKTYISSISFRPGTAMAAAPRTASTATTSTTQTGSLSSAPVRPMKPRRSSLPRPVTADPNASRGPQKMENPSVSPDASLAKGKPKYPARAVSNGKAKVAATKALKQGRAASDDEKTKSARAIASLKMPATTDSSLTKSTEDMPNPMSPTAILGVNGHMSSVLQEDILTSMSPKAILDVDGCMPSNRQEDMPKSRKLTDRILRANSNKSSVKESGVRKSMSPREPYSRKENMPIPRVWDRGQRLTPPMKVYEDPVAETEIQVISRPDTKVTALEELPLNGSTNSQSTRTISPRGPFADEMNRRRWMSARVLDESRQPRHQETYEPKMARKLLESGIALMQAGTMDVNGLRDLQSIIRAKTDIWNDTTIFDRTLMALLDYFEPSNTELEPQVISREVTSLKTQILVAIRMMLCLHRESFSIYYSLALCRMLSARKHYKFSLYLTAKLEQTARNIVLNCDPHLCLDGVLDLMQIETKDEEGNRTRMLGMTMLVGLLRFNPARKVNIIDLPDSEMRRLFELSVAGMIDYDSDIRKHALEYTLILDKVVAPEKFSAWLESLRVDLRDLVKYYLSKA